MPNDPKMAEAVPVAEPKKDSLTAYGIEIAPADDGAGVKVTKVDPQSSAAERGLKEGDVILEVAGNEVNNVDGVLAALKKTSGAKVLMLVRSGDGQHFVALPRAKS
jgi:serine protease Do